jgi:hypothetical protein
MALFPVTSAASFVGVGDVVQMTVTNIGDVSVFYKSEQDVDSGDTEVAADATVTISAGQWFITELAGTVSQLIVVPVAAPTVAELNASAAITEAFTGTPLVSQEITFTEVATLAAAGTYTGTVTLPAGSTLVDIIISGVAVWNDGTSASMEIGNEDDPDGYFTAVNLVAAQDLLAGESINFDKQGATGGADATAGTSTHIMDRYSAAAMVITATVAVGAGLGTTGRTRVTVLYSLPTSAYVTAAVGVAS